LAALVVTGPALAQDTGGGTSLTITLSDFAFAPDPIVLQHGQTYHLHFVNDSSSSHDFKAPEFFAAATLSPDARAKIADGAIELKEHTTLDIDLVPATAGKYPVECSHFMHAMMGMTTNVVVQ
jgi:plastocyanin